MKAIVITLVCLVAVAAVLSLILFRGTGDDVALQTDGQQPAEQVATASPETTDSPETPSAVIQDAGEPTPEAGDPVSSEDTVVTPDPVEQSDDAEASGATSTPDTEAPVAEGDAVDAPEFDVVRIDPKGQAVVAGRAEPGSEVEIVLDGKVVAREKADASGNFVSLFSVPPSDDPSALTLRSPQAVAGAGALGENAEQPDPSNLDATAPRPGTVVSGLAGSDPAPPLDGGLSAGSGSGVTASTNVPSAPDGSAPDDPLPSPDPVLAQRGDDPTEASGVDAGESAPVLILPSGVAGQAPAIVQPEAQELALLQSPAGDVAGVRLDRISYAAGGFVDLLGRAGPGNTVRIYVNAQLAGQAVTVSAGQWRVILPGSRMRDAVLLRFDEISADGKVLSRIETPFVYERTAGPKALGKQSVEIEKGDYLWRIAEQYYGEGIRYSLIFSANSGLIKDPDLIYPGQVFTLPALVDSE